MGYNGRNYSSTYEGNSVSNMGLSESLELGFVLDRFGICYRRACDVVPPLSKGVCNRETSLAIN